MSAKNKYVKRSAINDAGIPLTGIESIQERQVRLEKQKLASSSIGEGTVFCFSLESTAQSFRIEVNNFNIVSLLLREDNGVLYGATSGDEDHIFFMDKTRLIFDLGKIDKKINKNSLAVADNKFLYLAATDKKNNTFIFKHDTDSDYITTSSLYDLYPVVETDVKIKNEVFIEAIFNKWDSNIYYLSDSGKIFKLNAKKEKMELVVELGNGSSETFCSDNSGNLYGVLYGGLIFKYSLVEDKLIETGARIPSQKGRKYLSGVKKMVLKDNIIYGCTSQDAYLFKYDISGDKVFNFGKPDDNFDIRSIAIGKDGIIYGATGTKDRGVGYLFTYDKNGFKHLGSIAGYVPVIGHCNEPATMVLGSDGEIFIADGDNRSKLFIYFPKIGNCEVKNDY
jgi:hypothetical protein